MWLLATIVASGNIAFKGLEFTSLSKWAKHVAGALGLTKHYNGWKVCLHKPTQRPMGQFRDKYYAEHAGLTYSFPPLETKKRKRASSHGESLRKPRSATLERHASATPSATLSDTESNTSSQHADEMDLDYDLEMYPGTRRSSRLNPRTHPLFTTLSDSDLELDSPDDEEDWVRAYTANFPPREHLQRPHTASLSVVCTPVR